MASLASVDIRSSTGSNLFGIRREFKMDTNDNTLMEMRTTILEETTAVPDRNSWRIICLKNYLERRYQLQATYQDTTDINLLIESICKS